MPMFVSTTATKRPRSASTSYGVLRVAAWMVPTYDVGLSFSLGATPSPQSRVILGR